MKLNEIPSEQASSGMCNLADFGFFFGIQTETISN